jgi:hypothetical protein
MRLRLPVVVFCAVLPAAAWGGLAECAAIERALERLDCFDELARQELASETASATPASQPGPAASTEAPRVLDTRTVAQPAEDAVAASRRFGFRVTQRAEPLEAQVSARIERVNRTPLGHQIMTLSNGQVWAENEPGRRPIVAGQDVTIREHRWHFEMQLDGQPNVAVRRIE